jgi:hypothetical protein
MIGTALLQGLSFGDRWGSLRMSANVAFVALAYSKSLPAGSAQQQRYTCWAISQIRSVAELQKNNCYHPSEVAVG